MSLSFVALNVTVLRGLPPRDAGAGSGLLQASQQVGLSLGVAVLTTVFQSAVADRGGSVVGGTVPFAAYAHGLSTAAIVAAACCTVALLIAAFAITAPRPAAA